MTEIQAMEVVRAPSVARHPKELHMELRQDLGSLTPPVPDEVGGTETPGVKGTILTPAAKKKVRPNLLGKLNLKFLDNLKIVTVGGPSGLGKCATNAWSGLQITNPVAVPGQVQGFNIGHF
jgi:hypothetical protein